MADSEQPSQYLHLVRIWEPKYPGTVLAYFKAIDALNVAANVYNITYIAHPEMLKKLEEALNGKV